MTDSEISWCVTPRCTVRGEHLEDCPGGECRGCRPRQAERGALCERCRVLLSTDLGAVPALLHHLREIGRLDAVASAKPLSADPPPPRKPGEGTVLPAAWLAADELASQVASWALLVLEEHPAGLHGPNASPWHGDVVAWLMPHLGWVAAQDWAGEMRRQLGREVATLCARWPLPEDAEPDRPVPAMRCPRCDVVALRYYPPAKARQPFAVACTECGRIFTEDEWERLVALTARTERTVAS